MNIKAAFQTMISSPLKAVKKGEKKDVKSESSTDRDSDGRRDHNDDRRKLSAEEQQELIKHLKNLPGVVENGLIVTIEKRSEVQVLLIQTTDGRVVRRIPESEFYPIFKNQTKATGKILDKAM